ncbi:MAG: DUF5995 family protein, partial [Marinirhabdus sp.]
MKQARTIDEVVQLLDQIITTETQANSTLAFFPVLYKKVTQRIKTGIENGEFENNPRMEILDVIFANRYLKAYQQLKLGERPSKSWAKCLYGRDQQKVIG